MSETKYGHLVKPLSVGGMDMEMQMAQEGIAMGAFAKGPGNADQLVWLNGRDHLEGMQLNFTWGFYSGLGDWHTGLDPHIHPYPECLVFVGLDPTDINYLGAELEIALGEELEVYTFDKPTVVVVPAGFPHCPLITKKVTSPKGFGFYLISLGDEPETTWLGEGVSAEEIAIMQEMAAKRGMKLPMKLSVGEKRIKVSKTAKTMRKKYAHLVKPLRSTTMLGPGTQMTEMMARMEEAVKSGQKIDPAMLGLKGEVSPDVIARYEEMIRSGLRMGPGNADQLVWMYGSDLEGLNLNFTWGFYSKPGIWHRGGGAHVHPVDEVLVFVGLDPTNIDYLGAELEIDMGKEHERYVFNKPTVVICPGGLPHLPLVTRWVDQPYSFYVIGLGAEHESPFVD